MFGLEIAIAFLSRTSHEYIFFWLSHRAPAIAGRGRLTRVFPFLAVSHGDPHVSRLYFVDPFHLPGFLSLWEAKTDHSHTHAHTHGPTQDTLVLQRSSRALKIIILPSWIDELPI